MKKKFGMLLILLLTFPVLVFSQRPAAASASATEAVKDAIGSDIKKYTAYSYPTNNFGVGTSCKGQWLPRGIMICDMATCFGLTAVSQNSQAWKNVNGYAFFGQGGPLTLNDTLNQQYGVGVLLSKILGVLNINMGMERKQTKSVKLTIDSAVLRFLNFEKYKQFALSGTNSLLKDSYLAKELVVATSDFVLMDYSIEISPVDSFGINLITKLNEAIKDNTNPQKMQDSIGVGIRRERNGTFSLKSSKPVVFAVFIRKQKQIGLQDEGKKDFSDWEPVEFINGVITRDE
ncbi:MAG: hypothetical protein JNN00_06645 [Chitinophagaceae bacterium]|nr:hypothetical protein [Chitinophagaceae bacterium]